MDTWIDLIELRSLFEIATLTPVLGGESSASQNGFDRLADRATAAGIDGNEFRAAATEYIESAKQGDFSKKRVFDLISDRRAQIETELSNLGSTLEKSETLLQALANRMNLTNSEVEAYADRCVELRNHQRRDLAEVWRAEWLSRRSERLQAAGGEAFWVSADFHDHYDDVAYYRVYERYGFGVLDQLFDDVANGIGERLVDGLATGDPFGRSHAFTSNQGLAFAENLWLVSRSPGLRVRLADIINSAVRSLFHGQNSEHGWWPSPLVGEGGLHPPSVEATALSVIVGRRLSRFETHVYQMNKAVDWLITQQDADGHWTDERGQPDALNTALALDAISGIGRGGTEALREKASSWLLECQSATGFWNLRLPDVLGTVVVLDALRRSASVAIIPVDLASGLALVRRSEFLAVEHSVDARQLAVIAAYTGLEAVLYALLRNPQFDVNTVRPNGRTIGIDEALLKFEEALRRAGCLGSNQHVTGHALLRTFTHVRDGIVHHGVQPTAGDTLQIVQATVAFVRAEVPRTFGFDPFDD